VFCCIDTHHNHITASASSYAVTSAFQTKYARSTLSIPQPRLQVVVPSEVLSPIAGNRWHRPSCCLYYHSCAETRYCSCYTRTYSPTDLGPSPVFATSSWCSRAVAPCFCLCWSARDGRIPVTFVTVCLLLRDSAALICPSP